MILLNECLSASLTSSIVVGLLNGKKLDLLPFLAEVILDAADASHCLIMALHKSPTYFRAFVFVDDSWVILVLLFDFQSCFEKVELVVWVTVLVRLLEELDDIFVH